MIFYKTECVACGVHCDHALIRDRLAVYQWCPCCKLITVANIELPPETLEQIMLQEWASDIAEIQPDQLIVWVTQFEGTCDIGSTLHSWKHPLGYYLEDLGCPPVNIVDGIRGEVEHYRPFTPFEQRVCDALPIDCDTITADMLSDAIKKATTI